MGLVVPRSQQMCIDALDQANDLSGEDELTLSHDANNRMVVAAPPIAENAEVTSEEEEEE